MRYIKDFIYFLRALFQQRYLIFQLARRDFQNRYLSSFLGLFWAFAQPSVSMLVMWFVVTFGFKAAPVNNELPYGIWFICGYIPWIFISDTITGGTSSLLEYSYLIKKIYFRSSIIPLVKLLTYLAIHLFFVLLAALFAVGYGYYPTWHWLQLPYYLFGTLVLAIGTAWLTGSVTVFVRDVGQLVSVGMQLAFWATPVIWHHGMLQGKMKYLVTFNPLFYIVNGYRESFFSQGWFFEQTFQTLYFWGVTGAIFLLGAFVFTRLRPHFADVL